MLPMVLTNGHLHHPPSPAGRRQPAAVLQRAPRPPPSSFCMMITSINTPTPDPPLLGTRGTSPPRRSVIFCDVPFCVVVVDPL